MKADRFSIRFFSHLQAGFALALTITACASNPHSRGSCESNERIPSMGAVFEIQMVGPCGADSRDTTLRAAKERLDTIETSMSLYQKESEISRVNRGESVNPSPDFRKVLELALEHSEKTAGYFDITIWPVLSEIKSTIQKTGRPPSEARLGELRARVGSGNVRLTPKQVDLLKPGAQLSMDGIAKGYAVDEVARLLESSGFRSYLVNFSGNMLMRGSHADGRPWQVAFLNPVSRQTLPASLRDGDAIASSGVDYESYTPDRKWHHLIDPKTLKPARHVVGSTVIGPSAAICDALSTAAFVMGPEKARSIFAKEYPKYRYWMVDSKNRVHSNFIPAPTERKPKT